MAIEILHASDQSYGLTTANILYRLPDYPTLLQNFIWQTYDIHPQFPELKKFLEFWSKKLDGAIHSVIVAHHGLIKPTEFKLIGSELTLH